MTGATGPAPRQGRRLRRGRPRAGARAPHHDHGHRAEPGHRPHASDRLARHRCRNRSLATGHAPHTRPPPPPHSL